MPTERERERETGGDTVTSVKFQKDVGFLFFLLLLLPFVRDDEQQLVISTRRLLPEYVPRNTGKVKARTDNKDAIKNPHSSSEEKRFFKSSNQGKIIIIKK